MFLYFKIIYLIINGSESFIDFYFTIKLKLETNFNKVELLLINSYLDFKISIN